MVARTVWIGLGLLVLVSISIILPIPKIIKDAILLIGGSIVCIITFIKVSGVGTGGGKTEAMNIPLPRPRPVPAPVPVPKPADKNRSQQKPSSTPVPLPTPSSRPPPPTRPAPVRSNQNKPRPPAPPLPPPPASSNSGGDRLPMPSGVQYESTGPVKVDVKANVKGNLTKDLQDEMQKQLKALQNETARQAGGDVEAIDLDVDVEVEEPEYETKGQLGKVDDNGQTEFVEEEEEDTQANKKDQQRYNDEINRIKGLSVDQLNGYATAKQKNDSARASEKKKLNDAADTQDRKYTREFQSLKKSMTKVDKGTMQTTKNAAVSNAIKNAEIAAKDNNWSKDKLEQQLAFIYKQFNLVRAPTDAEVEAELAKKNITKADRKKLAKDLKAVDAKYDKAFNKWAKKARQDMIDKVQQPQKFLKKTLKKNNKFKPKSPKLKLKPKKAKETKRKIKAKQTKQKETKTKETKTKEKPTKKKK